MRQIIHTTIKSYLPLLAATIITILSGTLLLPPHSFADSASRAATVTVPSSCTMSGDIASGSEHTATVNGGSYTAGIGETVLNILCNDLDGYSVYAVGYSGTTGDIYNTAGTIGNTYMLGSNTGLTIPTGLATDGIISNWAMKLTGVTGTFTPTILSDANGSYSSYHIIPSDYAKVATFTDSINLTSASQIKTTYAASISPTQAADTYVGQVKYLVVHPSYTHADGTTESYNVTLSLSNAESITIDGTTYTSTDITTNPTIALTHGTHSISATFPTGYELDSWSSTGAVSITDASATSTTIKVTGEGTLNLAGKLSKLYLQDVTFATCTTTAATAYDNRDEQAYTIQRLNDGRCWMMNNLNLGATDLTTNLTSSNTHIATGSTISATEFNGWKKSSGTGTYTAAEYIPVSGTDSTSGTPYGTLYNYCAASAQTICTSSNSSNASYDLCPAGWRLPTGGSSGEFQTLYNNSSYNSNAKMRASIANGGAAFALAGYFSGSTPAIQGSYGYYWSSTRSSGSSMYYLSLDTSDVNPATDGSRGRGRSIRCILNATS